LIIEKEKSIRENPSRNQVAQMRSVKFMGTCHKQILKGTARGMPSNIPNSVAVLAKEVQED